LTANTSSQEAAPGGQAVCQAQAQCSIPSVTPYTHNRTCSLLRRTVPLTTRHFNAQTPCYLNFSAAACWTLSLSIMASCGLPYSDTVARLCAHNHSLFSSPHSNTVSNNRHIFKMVPCNSFPVYGKWQNVFLLQSQPTMQEQLVSLNWV
jgi:hypothetical protein